MALIKLKKRKPVPKPKKADLEDYEITKKLRKGDAGKLIMTHAKKIYKKGKESWHDAVRRASLELKEQGKF